MNEFWARPLDDLRRELAAKDGGLSSAEAEAILARVGPNEAKLASERPAWLEFASKLASPLVVVLLVGSAIAGVLGDPKSFTVIACVLVTSVTLDFVQERRARGAALLLRRKVETRATVLRDGVAVELPARALVPGDVVLLEPGDLVPADARVLDAENLQLQEASLTGEAAPVDKSPADVVARSPSEATSSLFAGTTVVAGRGRALVVVTGSGTELAKAAAALHHAPPMHPFERGTQAFGLLIVRFTIVLVLFVLIVHALSGRRFLESLLFSLALAVGLTPELLPMIVSVTLAKGALRMANAGVIVKRLSAIHDLGSMDVFCTDKTGTLTQAKIAVVASTDPAGNDATLPLVWARAMAVASSSHRTGIDEALLARRDVEAPVLRALDEIPFDPTHRWSGLLAEHEGERRLIVKGAAEEVLRACAISAQVTLHARERIDAMSADGLRVLAVASRPMGLAERASFADAERLELLGFVAFADPPKLDAKAALASLQNRGIAIKIVTGDSELVSRHVARALGLPVSDSLQGHEVDALDDHALRVRVGSVDLFCRMTPVQKNRVVLALEAAGHVVGYLGDGINDAPPLRSAHVGISVDSAVDVARDAADLILGRPDLAVLDQGVVEGRRTVANVTKYVLMATSSNFGNMVSMALASLILPFLPLLPVQILVNNLLYDVSELALPFDDVDEEAVSRPRRWDTGVVRRFMLVLGPVSSLYDLLTFFFLYRILRVDQATFRSGWFVESLVSQVAVIFVIRTSQRALSSRPNPRLVATSLGVAVIAVALPFTFLGRFIGLVPLPLFALGPLAAIIVAYLVTAELVKRAALRWAHAHAQRA